MATEKRTHMSIEQLTRMREGKGFIAAMDQSGGITHWALKLFGVQKDTYHPEEEMNANGIAGWFPVDQSYGSCGENDETLLINCIYQTIGH